MQEETLVSSLINSSIKDKPSFEYEAPRLLRRASIVSTQTLVASTPESDNIFDNTKKPNLVKVLTKQSNFRPDQNFLNSSARNSELNSESLPYFNRISSKTTEIVDSVNTNNKSGLIKKATIVEPSKIFNPIMFDPKLDKRSSFIAKN